MKLDPGTVKALREFVERRRKKGIQCPICTQRAQEYHRQIYNKMAVELIRLYHFSAGYHHVTELRSLGGDFSKMVLWELIQEKAHDKEDSSKKTSGMWKITPKGREFVEGKISIPKYVVLFDAKVIEFSTEKTTIRQCLGKKFDYSALMRGDWE